jgi:uncharacterized membrane protein/nitrite reductase/ring-hydroxylating ferredoxin subunit
MKSRASIKGHPIHPILIGFPIAFFTGTLVFDTVAFIKDYAKLWDVAYYLELAGIIAAIAAAIPGLLDYIFTVPPASSAKKRAARHGLTNTTMLILFIIAFYYRQREEVLVPVLLGLETLGFVLMLIAGWMGGTLVYKNQIAVVNRYANSGKWKEQYISGNPSEEAVAEKDELKLNQLKLVHCQGKRIVIGKTEDGYVAFDDRCTHKGGSLAGGMMICSTVQCPWHGSQFDVKTGAVKAGPGTEKINTYILTERDGKVFLQLPGNK